MVVTYEGAGHLGAMEIYGRQNRGKFFVNQNDLEKSPSI
jgi:hypothetical protein